MQTSPNGKVTTYEYYPDAKKPGLLKTISSTWHDENGAHAQVTSYEYTASQMPDIGGLHDYPSREETTIDGITVFWETRAYEYKHENHESVPKPVDMCTITSYVSTSEPIQTKRAFFHKTTSYATGRNPYAEIDSTGLQCSYLYEFGTYSNGVFVASPLGKAWRTSIVVGSSIGEEKTNTLFDKDIEPIQLIAGQSTLTQSIRDQNDNVVEENVYVYDGTDFDFDNPIASTRTTWADSVTPVQRDFLNGTTEKWTWNGLELASYVDAQGQTTTYTYDPLNRISSRTMAGAGSREDMTTIYLYDAAHRITAEVLSAGELTSTTNTWYDAAGRPTKKLLPDGRMTTTTYEIRANGNSVISQTLSCGGTRIIENLPDGKLLSSTGSIGVPEYYHYALSSNGTITRTTHYGLPDSSRWASATTDWLGRTISERKPGFTAAASNPVTLTNTYTYNEKGLLEKIANSSGLADILYEYDNMGQVFREGSDTDGDGVLSLASSTDRITESKTTCEKIDGSWWRVSEASVYANAGSAAAISMGKSGVRLSGYSTGLVAETWQEDRLGNRATSRTMFDADLQRLTTYSTAPGVAGQTTVVTTAGRTESITGADGRSLSYAYDALGRQTSETDSRTGATTYTYQTIAGNATSRIDTVTDPNNATVAYAYDSGGRVSSIKNAIGAHVYFSYDCSGRLLQQWGDAVTPVSYGYNIYGERTTMRTYRTGSLDTWKASAWPDDQLADSTTWTYDAATGLLLTKRDAANQGADYIYTDRGQLKIRQAARTKAGSATERIETTYGYDPKTGELTGVTYNDETPSVAYTYTRLGQPATVTDATGIRTYTYDGANPERLLREDLPTYYDSRRITYTYQDAIGGNVPGRLGSYALGVNGAPAQDLSTAYGYDTLGRINALSTMSSGDTSAQTYSYAYEANTSLLSTLTRDTGNFSQTRAYDTKRDLITNMSVTGANDQILAANAYAHDLLGRRATRVQSGTAFDGYGQATHWRYAYNERNELTVATHCTGADAASGEVLRGRDYAYSYDAAGNRTSGNHTGNAGLANAYTLNNLNQITNKENNSVSIQGVAAAGAHVLVNGISAAWTGGRYWSMEFMPDNENSPAWIRPEITAAVAGSSGQRDYKRIETPGGVFASHAQEVFRYDADGNPGQTHLNLI